MDLKLVNSGTVTDRFGRETIISVLMDGSVPVAVIHSQDKGDHYNDDAIHQEHVIQGIEIELDNGQRFSHDDILDSSCPSRTRIRLSAPKERIGVGFGDVDIFNEVKADYDWSNGFNFVKYGAKGEKVPADASAAFFLGMDAAKKRTGRIVRANKLTGEPRTW
jgi:hypothetical protein